MPPHRDPARRVRRLLLFTVAVILVAAVLVWWVLRQWTIPAPPPPNSNQLALGEQAQAEALDIPIEQPIELDGLSRAQVYALRAEAVSRWSALIAGSYTPYAPVFGEIIDGRPWWGMVGQWFYGNGERSIAGVSEEARFILNPYLLVAPEFFGFSFYGGGMQWNDDTVNAEVLAAPDFPLTCWPPIRLYWAPAAREAEAIYDVTGCMAGLNQHARTPLTLNEDGWFDLITYNARDLHLPYLYVDYTESSNIGKNEPPTGAVASPHFLHVGNSCGYPGGCNNMSPAFPALEGLAIEALPATLVVRLWQQAPPSAQAPPDLTYRIHFE